MATQPNSPPTSGKVQLIVGNTKQKAKPRGKGFQKGNQFGRKIKPGQVLNPNGCLGKSRGTKILSQVYTIGLEEQAPAELANAVGLESGTWAEIAGRVLIRNAVKGDIQAIKELREVTEGKIPDKVYLTGNEGAPLTAPVLHVQFVDGPRESNEEESKE